MCSDENGNENDILGNIVKIQFVNHSLPLMASAILKEIIHNFKITVFWDRLPYVFSRDRVLDWVLYLLTTY
jgi:hypothetical protein